MASNTILGRFRQGLGIGVGLAVLVYGVYFVRSDFAEVAGSLGRFAWGWLPVLLLLSLGNYAIRFLRWELYLRMLDIRVPLKMSLSAPPRRRLPGPRRGGQRGQPAGG